MAGLTNQGLDILSLTGVLTQLEEAAKIIFADQVPEGDIVDVSEKTLLGRLIGVVAPADADLWEALQDVHDAFNPNAATGAALDNLVTLTGLTRFPATKTRVGILVEGSINTFITSGSKVKSSFTGQQYSINSPINLSPDAASGIGVALTSVVDNSDYTITYLGSADTTPTPITINSGVGATEASIFSALITEIQNNHPLFLAEQEDSRLFIRNVNPYQLFSFGTSGNIGVQKVLKVGTATAEDFGAIVQAANTVDSISTPILGWDSVTNPEAGTTGRDVETDEELRERFRNSKFEKATNILEALYSAISSVNGVTDFIIYENDTDTTSVDGIPPHSFYPIVDGGDANEIARAIWENKPLGILSFGNSTITVEDSQGFPHDVSYSIPTKINGYIQIELTTDSEFPQDGYTKIQDKILAYVSQLSIGEDVVYSRLYTPINEVPGHQIESLKIGLSPDPTGTSNIIVPFDSKIQVLRQNITFV